MNYELPIGTVLDSGIRRYRITDVLGHGGFGITYKAVGQVKVGNIVVPVTFAIKEHFISQFNSRQGALVTIPNSSNANEVKDSMAAFLAEARRLNSLSLQHPGIVQVNESFEANGTAYYVMEFVEGESLRHMVEHRKDKRLSEDEAVGIISRVGASLTYLHSNRLTHLDVKPDNILIRNNGQPVLIDFGLAKHYDSQGKATSTMKVGGVSDGYSPLEQYAGISTFHPEADVYALAATLLFAMTGSNPKKAPDITVADITTALRECSSGISSAIQHAMTKLPEQRTSSVEAFVKELGGAMASFRVQPIGINVAAKDVSGQSTPRMLGKFSELTKPQLAMIAAAAATILLLLILFWPSGSTKKPISEDFEDEEHLADADGDDDESNATIRDAFTERMTPGEINELGDDYFYGRNGKQVDYDKAAKYFRMAAKLGDSDGQCNMGYMYINGFGVKQSNAKGAEWYTKSARQGNAEAQHNLGIIYENGRGVKQDYIKAAEWYLKAAEQGHADGQANLGYLYEEGLGVERDYVKAAEWYLKAAEQGLARGQANLAELYYYGHGMERDYVKAAEWYLKAAEQGNVLGQYSLGYMYENGIGVKQDIQLAKLWYEKAAAQGDEDSIERLQELK